MNATCYVLVMVKKHLKQRKISAGNPSYIQHSLFGNLSVMTKGCSKAKIDNKQLC